MMVLTLQPFAAAQDPFSDPEGFLAAAKERLRGNFLFELDTRELRNYLWTLEIEENRLNSKRELKKQYGSLSVESFEPPQGVFARRTLDNSGNVLRQYAMSVYRSTGGAYSKSAGAWAIEFRDKVWSITQFRLLGREMLNGRASIVFAFRTQKKADFKGIRQYPLKRALKAEGRVWFDEEDKTLVKVEGEYYGRVVLARGFLVGGRDIPKGSSWRWEMEKFDDQTWLPMYLEDLSKYRGFFSTSFYQIVTRYGNYRKRSVP